MTDTDASLAVVLTGGPARGDASTDTVLSDARDTPSGRTPASRRAVSGGR
ncbi:hypothetical protein [Halobaculum limi]|nr:hypothetical protein [Halobaculum sp. YSMS11]